MLWVSDILSAYVFFLHHFFYRLIWKILVLIAFCDGLTLASHKVPTKLLYYSPSSGKRKGNMTKCSWLNIKTWQGEQSLIHYCHGQNSRPRKTDLINCNSKVRAGKWEVKTYLKAFSSHSSFLICLTSLKIFFTSFPLSSTGDRKWGSWSVHLMFSLLLLPPTTISLPQHGVSPMGDSPLQIAPRWMLATNCNSPWTSCPHHHLVYCYKPAPSWATCHLNPAYLLFLKIQSDEMGQHQNEVAKWVMRWPWLSSV